MNVRAERRRTEKLEAKREQYAKSGFKGGSTGGKYSGEVRALGARSRSKYTPHYGTKEQAKWAAKAALEAVEAERRG